MTDAQDAPRRSRVRQIGAVVASVVAGLVCLLLAVGAAAPAADEPGRLVGAIVGRLFATFALALLVRWLYVRFVSTGRSLWSPWLLVIAAFLSLLLSLPQIGARVQNATRFTEADELLAPAPAGYRYGRLPADVERQIVDSFPRQDPPQDFVVRTVTRERQPGGAVIGLVFDEAIELDDIAQGFEGSGGTTRRQQIDGADAVVGTAPNGGAVAFRAEANAILFAIANDPPQATRTLALAAGGEALGGARG